MRALVALLTLALLACSGETARRTPARSSSASARIAAASVASEEPAPTLSSASSSSSPPPALDPEPLDPAIAGQIHAPPAIDAGARYPFVLFLHGLGGTGRSFAAGLGVEKLAAAKQFFWAAPDGAMDKKKRLFWSATAGCCDFDHTGVDHVASLGALIRQARRTPGIDPGRVFVIGFSNGAFMAHRLGCSVPGIAGIVSVAGAAPTEGTCAPEAPVVVLEIHGDADKAVRFEGGHVLDLSDVPEHRSVEGTMGVWATANGCSGPMKEEGQLDLMAGLGGAETRDLRFPKCRAPVALWRVVGGDHFVATSRSALDQIWAFLASASTATSKSH
ncbi:MAG: PHB depolymerase family esterase [Polyangiaceae bacterium]